MNEYLKSFVDGFVQGARETPRGFFAPITAFFGWLNRVTDEAMHRSHADSKQHLVKH